MAHGRSPPSGRRTIRGVSGSGTLRRGAAALVCAGTAFFWAAAVATQFRRVEYDPLVTRLSEYLSGPWGGLLHAGYYVLAGAVLLFAWLLHEALPWRRRSRTLIFLLILTAFATAATAAARPLTLPPPGRPSGPREAVHVIAAISAFASASIALVLAALRFHDLLQRGWARTAFVLAALENAAFLSYLVMPSPWPGARQKLLVLLVTVPLFLAAARLARRPPLAVPPPAP